MITNVIVIFFCDYDYIFPVISIIITIFYDYDPNHEFFMITTVITTFLLIAAVITNTFPDFTITVAIIRVYDYCCNRNRNHISKYCGYVIVFVIMITIMPISGLILPLEIGRLQTP
uniref:Uncharacterized protein n=1 Tax=Cacopsylla melanoneura TaxID=428564 RepID=A0A8D8PMN5_9HEMI